ncbi:MAG TPA: response regulator transcription factor, partial [Acetobacteraceae bacterium]|nr:response regulator transcription factor [Acetobacteraceae bacterium]
MVNIHGQACVLGVMQDITERKRSEAELMAAIEAVMQDASWFSQRVMEKLANLRQPHGSNKPTALLKDLTPRERDVLGLVCRGLDDREIAERLCLSHNTVRNQVAAIYRKTDVHRRAALVAWGRERGLTGEERPRRTGDGKR